MTKAEAQNNNALPHDLILEGREKLTVTGVRRMLRCDPDSAAMETTKGTLTLAGAQLSVNSLDLDKGEVKLTGRVDVLEYTAQRTAGGFLLFMPVGAPKPTRIQGTFVRDEEISRVLNFIKQSATVQYDDAMIEAMERKEIQDGKKGGSGSAESDEDSGSEQMLKQAVEVVIDAGQASTSLLQRRCKLGYARAARIMDEMEEKGLIGPYEGAKPRAVLISRQQWLEMQMNQPEE